MKILIIGNGQIGSQLAKRLNDFEVEMWAQDIDDLSIVEIERIDPAAIVNAAGKTDLKWCEDHPHETLRSNLTAPFELYKRIVSLDRDIRYFHFSSGCVWDGPYDEKGTPFEPNSPVSPACLYSWSKAACDAMLLELNRDNVAVLRPRQVFSSEPSNRNLLTKLARYSKLVDTPNSMSSLEVIEQSIRHLLVSEDWTGIWNIYDRGIISPFEVGTMLAGAGLREQPLRVSKTELDSWHTPRRVDTVLHDARFEMHVQPRDVRDVLFETIDDYRQAARKAEEEAINIDLLSSPHTI